MTYANVYRGCIYINQFPLERILQLTTEVIWLKAILAN